MTGLCRTGAATRILGIITRSTRLQLSGAAIVNFRLVRHAPGNVGFHSKINRLVERPNASEVLCLREIEPIVMLYASPSAWIRRTQTSAMMEQHTVRSNEKRVDQSFNFPIDTVIMVDLSLLAEAPKPQPRMSFEFARMRAPPQAGKERRLFRGMSG